MDTSEAQLIVVVSGNLSARRVVVALGKVGSFDIVDGDEDVVKVDFEVLCWDARWPKEVQSSSK